MIFVSKPVLDILQDKQLAILAQPRALVRTLKEIPLSYPLATGQHSEAISRRDA